MSLDVRQAYVELRDLLLRNDCKIISEEPLRSITVEHGSYWGITPKGVKKKISFNFYPYDSGTRIAGISSSTAGYLAFLVLSYVLAGFLIGVFFLLGVALLFILFFI
ncbi:MAG: hypothetical protein QXS27_07250, partial [Candidatus Jordarchaeaceae archaeon]